MTACALSWESALPKIYLWEPDLLHRNPSQEKEIHIAKILVFPTGKSGRVEVMGHGSPVQWQSMILVSHLCFRRCFPFGNEMQESALGKTIVLTLSLRHNMEVKENFKQHGLSENHASPGVKPITWELSLPPDLLIRKRRHVRIVFYKLLII